MLPEILVAVAALSVIAFTAVGLDKRRSRLGRRRIPEATLLLFSWLGGFPGGFWGMGVFRHKTRKTSFKLKMVLATLLSPLWLALYFGA